MMARKKKTQIFVLLLLVVCGISAATTGYEGNKPNIVIVLVDDMGWGDVGYHGSKIATPVIDEFATEGVMLENFYVSPACTPTRVSLLTGRYAGRYSLQRGVITPNRRDGLSTDAKLISDVLKEAGYEDRACIGKWHLGHSDVKYHPLNRGFSYFYGHYGGMVDFYTHIRAGQLDWHRNFETSYDQGYTTHLIATEAVRFIENAEAEKPFFLYVAFNAPHVPLQAESAELDQNGFLMSKGLYSGPDPIKGDQANYLPADRKLRHFGQGNSRRQTYAAMVSSLDKSFGRILMALEECGMRENTLVLFMSDNGGHLENGASNSPLRGEKGKLYEGGVKVPAAIQWPAALKSGEIVRDLMAHIDVLPSLVDLVGEPGHDLQQYDGRSFLTHLPFKSPLHAQTEASSRLLYLGTDGLVTERWKLAYDELFDLSTDPYEKIDLSASMPLLYESLLDSLNFFRENINVPKKADKSYQVTSEWKMPGQ